MAHEELKKQWEEDRQKYGKGAHKFWEFRSLSNPDPDWLDCDPRFGPRWYDTHEYRRKELPFEPEYYSGLNWRDALPLVGKVVEFSDDPDSLGWEAGKLNSLDSRGGRRFSIKGDFHYEYIRTTPETHAHPTITLTVNGQDWVLPKPETEAPKIQSKYYLVGHDNKVVEYLWHGCHHEVMALKKGKIHLIEDRTQAWVDFWQHAILSAIKAD